MSDSDGFGRLDKELTVKRLVMFVGCLLMTAMLVSTAYAQGNRGTAKLELKGASISVDYGTPSLKGRNVNDLMAQVTPEHPWRLGSNASTTFKTSKGLVFGDVTVPAGTYSLWAAKDSDNSWKLVFNTQHGQSGNQHDPSKDAYKVPLKQETEEKSAEKVTITLEKEGGAGEFSVQWGTLELTANFDVK